MLDLRKTTRLSRTTLSPLLARLRANPLTVTIEALAIASSIMCLHPVELAGIT